jgi:hypothetical protein
VFGGRPLGFWAALLRNASSVALTSRLQTFETEMLAEEENFGSLARINPNFPILQHPQELPWSRCLRSRISP